MKKIISLLAILLALATCTAALAETATPLWDARIIQTISGNDSAVIVQSSINKKWGVLTLGGEIYVSFEYNDIKQVAPGYYRAFPDVSANNALLITSYDHILSPVTYHDYEVIDHNWFVGIKVEPINTRDGADYSIYTWGATEREYFRIYEYDVYYRPSGGKVGTLSRAEYDSAKAYDDHLLVKNRAGSVQLYDEHFTPVASSFDSLSNSPYYITKDGEGTRYITSRITEKKLLTGYSDVGNVLWDGTLLRAYTGDGYCLIDLNGEVLLSGVDYISTFYNDPRYIKVKKNNLYGLYDLEQQKLILPYEYTDILEPRTGMASWNGYFLVEKDGKIGYVDDTNQITCPIAYSKSAMTIAGALMFAADIDGTYKMVSADGIITPLAGVTEINKYSSQGKYVTVKNSDGLWGIMDWHGNLVVDYCAKYESAFEFVDDIHFVYNNTLYQIQ